MSRKSKVQSLWFCLVCVLWFFNGTSIYSETAEGLFARGSEAYQAGDYMGAARAFRSAAKLHPAAGSFQNLGNSEWQLGHTGCSVEWIEPQGLFPGQHRLTCMTKLPFRVTQVLETAGSRMKFSR